MWKGLRVLAFLALSLATPAWAQDPAFLDRQKEDDILVGRMIGARVHNRAGEALGGINEVLLTADGRLKAVVIGVGGFLGLAERNVAVPWERFEVSRDRERDLVLRLDVDRGQLENAPDFTLAAPRAAAERAEQPAPTSGQGTSEAVVPGTGATAPAR